jgi:UDP-N-acetylglucosamine 2-epimerase (non-hydrolysing)
MRVLSVVGARPQFVKLGPVHEALTERNHEHVIIHTGQHYDYGMSGVFFDELNIPAPSLNLEVGSGSHGGQTARMLERLEAAILGYETDWILVYGDTNSTIAAALAAVKLQRRVAHLEAGLRSFNRRMPEEHNRVLTDHASDLLLAPTDEARRNLEREGLGHRTLVIGDVMIDVCMRTRTRVEAAPPKMPDGWFDSDEFLVATIHRQENTESPSRLSKIIGHIASTAVEVRLLAHPRLIAKAREFGVELEQGKIRLFDPLSYPQLIFATLGAKGVITDSGGLQKEAFLLETPCVTLRTETEWIETVDLGWNTLDGDCKVSLDNELGRERTPVATAPYGIGDAAQRCVSALETRTNR